jgi:hypothetical protein
MFHLMEDNNFTKKTLIFERYMYFVVDFLLLGAFSTWKMFSNSYYLSFPTPVW